MREAAAQQASASWWDALDFVTNEQWLNTGTHRMPTKVTK